MKLLIISQTYPSKNEIYQNAYVHTRSLYYKKVGHSVDVISFAASKQYSQDDIPVYPESGFKTLVANNKYDAVVFHAPNLRNHIRFFITHLAVLPKVFFVFHGFEILRTSKYYPEPFAFKKESKFNRLLVDYYDVVKCFLMKLLIKKYGGEKLKLIFVSQYLSSLFEENVKIPFVEFKEYSEVIHNPVHPVFLENKYDEINREKLCITIRSFDKSVYAIDKVMEIAENNPDYTFHIYGKGEYFKHNKKPKNVMIFDGFLTPEELVKTINKYRFAIMLSHHDSQGVMATEMAYFGIPLIASNIPAAREMFASERGVKLVDRTDIKLDELVFERNQSLRSKVSLENTVLKELEYIGS
jgi:glycosyltransferase involved in cell wall biosynthesis